MKIKCNICGVIDEGINFLPAFREVGGGIVTNIRTCPHCGADVQANGLCAQEETFSKIRVYNAGPWFCKAEREAITRAYEVLSADLLLDVYSPLHSHPFNVRAYAHLPIDAPRAMYYAANAERTDAERRAVFEEDVRQVAACDAITAMIENWDPGTMFEAGMAHMRCWMRKRIDQSTRPVIVAWSYNPIREANLMLQQSIDAFTTRVEDLPSIIGKLIQHA